MIRRVLSVKCITKNINILLIYQASFVFIIIHIFILLYLYMFIFYIYIYFKYCKRKTFACKASWEL